MTAKEKFDVSLREFIENLVSELEKRMNDRFVAAEKAVAAALVTTKEATQAALAASDKGTAAAFAASKEALKEAQDRLSEYKNAANEWRGVLNDLVTNTTKQIADLKAELKETIYTVLNPIIDRVANLEKTGQYYKGQAKATDADHDRARWNFRDALSVIAIIASMAIGIYVALHK